MVTTVAGLQDDRLNVRGDDLRVPVLDRVWAIAAGCPQTTTIGPRLTAPSLDEFTNLRIFPFNSGADADPEPDSPPAWLDMRNAPLQLVAGEDLRAEEDSNPTAAALSWVLLWFSDGAPTPIGNARVFSVRGVDTGALTADVWSTAVLTLDESLPKGQYDVVGARFQSATCVAGRFIFREPPIWRAGGLGCDDDQDLAMDGMRYGGWGRWGTFSSQDVPDVEILASAGDTDLAVFIDLVRTGA